MKPEMPPPLDLPIDLSFLRSRAAQRRIAGAAVVLAILGGLYGKFGPKWYRSTVTVVPAKSQRSSGLAAIMGGDVAALAGGLDGALGGIGSDSSRIAAVLQSAAVTDAVIEKFQLKARYGKKQQEDARDALWGHCEVKTLAKPNLVQISCEDKDPAFVQTLLDFFASYGNEVFRRVNVGAAHEEVKYLEKRTAELRRQADDLSAAMREFQEAHGIVELDSQARALVTSVAALNSQRIAKQMELDYAQRFSSSDEAGKRQLESQLSVVDEKLYDLEGIPDRTPPSTTRGRNGKGTRPGMFPPAMEVPRLRAEFEKLYRDRKVAEATLVFALDRLEGARAAEARDVSTFVVLDPATLPTRKSRPIATWYFLAGGFVGLVASVVIEGWRSARQSRKRAHPDVTTPAQTSRPDAPKQG